MNLVRALFFSYVSETRLNTLSRMNLNQIMKLEDDNEFIWGLYLKFNSKNCVNDEIDENYNKFNRLGESYKKYIIGRVRKIAEIRSISNTIPVIVTAILALYTLLGDMQENIWYLFIIQITIIVMFVIADMLDKQYKSKCEFLIEIFK